MARRERAHTNGRQHDEEHLVLFDGSQQYRGSYPEREEATKKANEVGGRVLFFSVKITNYDRISKRVIHWEKTPGFSVWVRK